MSEGRSGRFRDVANLFRGPTAVGSLKLLPSSALPGLIGFIGIVLLAHIGGLHMVGLFSMTLVASAFGAAMLAGGPSILVLRHRVKEGPDHTSAYRTAMLERSLVFVPLGIALGLLIALWRTTVGGPIALASLLVIPESLFAFETSVLSAQTRFGRISAFASTRMAVGWGAAVATATRYPFLQVALAYIGALLVTGVIFQPPRLSRVVEAVRADLRGSWRQISSYSLAAYALNNGDQYILAIIAGPTAVGVYSLGYTVGGGVVSLFSGPVSGVLGPRVFREWEKGTEGRQRAIRLANRGALVVLALSIASAVAIAIAGALGWLDFVSKAPSLAPVAVIVALAVGLHMAATIRYPPIYYLRNRSGLLGRAAWYTLPPALIAIVVLSWKFTETGTAVATFFAYLIMAAIQRHYARSLEVEGEKDGSSDPG